MLELHDVQAGYGDAVVLDGASLELPDQGSLAGGAVVRPGDGQSRVAIREGVVIQSLVAGVAGGPADLGGQLELP